MTVSDTQLSEAFADILDPLTGQSFLAKRQLSWTFLEPNQLHLHLTLGYPARSLWPQLTQQLSTAAQLVAPLVRVLVDIKTQIQTHAVPRSVALLPGVKNIIAIASGKGGVGKSTTAANLALALSTQDARVGLLDADIYGPSQPWMMGLGAKKPESKDGQTMEPLISHGIQVMSMGFLVEADNPMIWRGPMATQALDQLLRKTHWQDLDYLIVDMPPGTGDIQLTLSQKVPLTGAVIVTTPQDIALLDAKKGLKMFEKVNVPVLGVIENMAVYHCPSCGHTEHIFGADGGQAMAAQYSVDYLGALPLAMSIREHADKGSPSVVSEPLGVIAQEYIRIAHKIGAKIACSGKDYSAKFPTITVSSDT